MGGIVIGIQDGKWKQEAWLKKYYFVTDTGNVGGSEAEFMGPIAILDLQQTHPSSIKPPHCVLIDPKQST